MRYDYEFTMTFEGPQYLIDVEKLSDGDKVLSLAAETSSRKAIGA